MQQGSAIEFYAKIKRSIAIQAEMITAPTQELADELYRIELDIITANKPQTFRTGHNKNALIGIDKGFVSFCAMLEQSGTNDPQKLSTFDFYARIDYIISKHTPTNKEK